MAEYDKDFTNLVNGKFNAETFKLPTYSFKVEPDFKMPPVLEVLRFLENFDDQEYQDRITRFCVEGRLVKVLVDGVEVSPGATLADRDAPWDVIPDFKENPLALKTLYEICGAFVLKNSMPSLR
jgi:hypothetical protein